MPIIFPLFINVVYYLDNICVALILRLFHILWHSTIFTGLMITVDVVLEIFFFFFGSLISLSLLFGSWWNFPRFFSSAGNCFFNLLKGVLNVLWIWVFLLLQMSELVLKLFLHLTTLIRDFLNVICCFSGYSVSSGALCSWYLKLKNFLDFLCHWRQKCLSSKIKKMVLILEVNAFINF